MERNMVNQNLFKYQEKIKRDAASKFQLSVCKISYSNKIPVF